MSIINEKKRYYNIIYQNRQPRFSQKTFLRYSAEDEMTKITMNPLGKSLELCYVIQ